MQTPELGWMALVRFAVELVLLAALAYVGWRLGDGGALGVLLAVGSLASTRHGRRDG